LDKLATATCPILILNWNGGYENISPVQSILNSKPKVDFEIIVIDQGSNPNEIKTLNKLTKYSISKKITKIYRIFHRVLVRFINFGAREWFSKAIIFEFFDAMKKNYVLLLVRAYLYYFFKIFFVIKLRKIRSLKNIEVQKLSMLLEKSIIS